MKNSNIIFHYTLSSVLLLLGFTIISCSGHSSTKLNDTAKQTPVDTIRKKVKSKLQQEKDDGVPSTDEILDGVRKSYKDTIKVDTTFIVMKHDTMRVKFRHYCTYDGKINLPNRYLKIYDIPKFQTHDFISSLELKINSKVVFKGIIKKEDFGSLLDDELKKYAVLISPNVKLSNNSLAIQYSISVPLSDVGKGVVMKIDTSGNKTYNGQLTPQLPN